MKRLISLHIKKKGVRREEGSGWGTRVYLWQIHVDIRQNQYNIVMLNNKIKLNNNNNNKIHQKNKKKGVTYIKQNA